MHGTIQLPTTTLRNRRGRKRKQGRRSPVTGDLVKVQIDYRALAAEQPHRVILPERFRGDDRAGTVLGALLLTERLGPHGRTGEPSGTALTMYRAGQLYAGIIGRYRAMIGIPQLGRLQWNVADDTKDWVEGEGSNKGPACYGQVGCGLDHAGKRIAECRCRNLTIDYNDANDTLECAGHVVHVVVNRVVVHDEPCQDWQLPALIIGLGTLAREFGLKS